MVSDSPTTFADWIATAKPGDAFVYYRGFLADSITPPTDHEKAEATAALESLASGRVELTQRRVELGVGKLPGKFEYRAQLRREVKRPSVYGVPWVTKLHGPYSVGGQY